MAQEQEFALSIKQPWATLLVYGLKTVEVRRWSTQRRGRVLIHTGSLPDRRKEGWALVPLSLRDEAEKVGGIIGAAELTECVGYETAETFAADRARHLNDPSWFRAPRLYGFVFANPTSLTFRRCRGALFFFPTAPAKERRQRHK
jgi:hypothetical protein